MNTVADAELEALLVDFATYRGKHSVDSQQLSGNGRPFLVQDLFSPYTLNEIGRLTGVEVKNSKVSNQWTVRLSKMRRKNSQELTAPARQWG